MLFLLSLSLLTCSQKNSNRTNVTFTFTNQQSANPFFDVITEQAPAPLIDGIMAPPTPVAFADFNCFGIMVTYPDLPVENFCYDQNSAIIVQPHDLDGLVPITGTLTMSILSGTGRIFDVIGFQSNVGCLDVFADDPAFDSDVSEPYMLGQTSVDVGGAVTDVNIVLNSTPAANLSKIGDCQGPLFSFLDGDIDCGIAPATYAAVTEDDINCHSNTMGVAFATDDLVTNNIILVETSQFSYAKLNVSSASDTNVIFDQSTWYDKTGLTGPFTNGADLTLNAANCVDLDTTSAGNITTYTDCNSFSDGGSGTADLKIITFPQCTGFCSPQTSFLIADGDAPGEDQAEMKMMNPGADMNVAVRTNALVAPFIESYTSWLGTKTIANTGTTGCLEVKIVSENEFHKFADVGSNTTATMEAYYVRTGTAVALVDVDCSTVKTSVTIPGSGHMSESFYIKTGDISTSTPPANEDNIILRITAPPLQPTAWGINVKP